VTGAEVPERLICRVEIPKGSRNKYEWDEELAEIFLSRFLSASVVYPTDYGFFPETLAEDGDPLDALVCVSEPTFPGCLIEVKPIALLGMTDEEGADDKILCVPCTDPNWMDLEELEDIPSQLRTEIEHFFSIYKQPEGKPVEVTGWRSREDALAALAQSHARYRDAGGA
jgi:inorganic pyrophosphatase